MNAYLICQVGRKAGTRVPLGSGTFLIGRATQCHLRSKSSHVSTRHCAIISRNRSVVVKDLGSRTGTYLNDRPVLSECRINSGDKLRVGPLIFVVEIARDAPVRLASQPPPVADKSSPSDAAASQFKVLVPDDADVLLVDVPGGATAMTFQELQQPAQAVRPASSTASDVSDLPGSTVAYVMPAGMSDVDLKRESA